MKWRAMAQTGESSVMLGMVFGCDEKTRVEQQWEARQKGTRYHY